jgi:hypothetical protein
MSIEINIDGPVSDGVSLPFAIVVRPTLTVFRQVTASTPEKLPGSLLSTEEAAGFLAISAETLRRLCRRKAIPLSKSLPSIGSGRRTFDQSNHSETVASEQ